MPEKKPRIVVLDGDRLNPGDNPWTEVEQYGEVVVHDWTPPEQVVERSKGAQILLTNKTVIAAEMMDQLPELGFIGVLATGFNVVDLEAARSRNIPVSNVPVYGTNSVAQYVFALLLELCHHVGDHNRSVQDGEWARGPWCYWNTPLVELYGKTMSVVGYGRIGTRVAEIAHALGMDVLAVDIVEKNPPAFQPFAFVELEEACRRADVVSLNCALTEDNVGIVDRRLLTLMKKDAFLINAARGPLIVEKDLAEALKAGRLAGAAVDVVSTEPIKADNPLLGLPNCIITPHMAWGALAARERLMHTTAENVRAFLAGSPQNVVN
jgi:glycerate dehydrogenase